MPQGRQYDARRAAADSRTDRKSSSAMIKFSLPQFDYRWVVRGVNDLATTDGKDDDSGIGMANNSTTGTTATVWSPKFGWDSWQLKLSTIQIDDGEPENYLRLDLHCLVVKIAAPPVKKRITAGLESVDIIAPNGSVLVSKNFYGRDGSNTDATRDFTPEDSVWNSVLFTPWSGVLEESIVKEKDTILINLHLVEYPEERHSISPSPSTSPSSHAAAAPTTLSSSMEIISHQRDQLQRRVDLLWKAMDDDKERGDVVFVFPEKEKGEVDGKKKRREKRIYANRKFLESSCGKFKAVFAAAEHDSKRRRASNHNRVPAKHGTSMAESMPFLPSYPNDNPFPTDEENPFIGGEEVLEPGSETSNENENDNDTVSKWSEMEVAVASSGTNSNESYGMVYGVADRQRRQQQKGKGKQKDGFGNHVYVKSPEVVDKQEDEGFCDSDAEAEDGPDGLEDELEQQEFFEAPGLQIRLRPDPDDYEKMCDAVDVGHLRHQAPQHQHQRRHSVAGPRPVNSQTKRKHEVLQVAVKDFEYKTFRAFLTYLGTGRLAFADLNSKHNPRKNDKTKEGNDDLLRVSPKSMYRLAKFYDDPSLQRYSFAAIKDNVIRNLTPQNVGDQFLSDLVEKHREIRELMIDFILENWTVVRQTPSWKQLVRNLWKAGANQFEAYESICEKLCYIRR